MHRVSIQRRALPRVAVLTAALGLTLAAPAIAAKTPPTVATGGTANVSPQSATLKGTVNPKGKYAAAYFQYGTSKAYGANTPETAAGAGAKNVPVAADIIGLVPNKTYHYRVVARNADGTTVGADKAFTSKKQPLGFTLAANPNPVAFGGAVTLEGVLSGTGNSGRQVALQQNVFPYTAGFATVGNPQVTGASGTFAFPLLGVTTNTQYRVVTTAGTRVTSQVVTLGVAVTVSTRVGNTRVKRGHRTRFSGTVHPAKRGAIFVVQRKTEKGNWIEVSRGTSAGGGATFSRYDKKVRIRFSGLYRVAIGVADGYQVTGVGRSVKLTARR
jgi:hypothetical protein